MTTEEIYDELVRFTDRHFSALQADDGSTYCTFERAQLLRVLAKLREQESLIAELQKDAERVEKMEAGHANVWPQFVLSGEYGFVLSCFQLEYDVGSGATEDFPTWREAVDMAAKAWKEAQP